MACRFAGLGRDRPPPSERPSPESHRPPTPDRPGSSRDRSATPEYCVSWAVFPLTSADGAIKLIGVTPAQRANSANGMPAPSPEAMMLVVVATIASCKGLWTPPRISPAIERARALRRTVPGAYALTPPESLALPSGEGFCIPQKLPLIQSESEFLVWCQDRKRAASRTEAARFCVAEIAGRGSPRPQLPDRFGPEQLRPDD
jgi:hypothetical protein